MPSTTHPPAGDAPRILHANGLSPDDARRLLAAHRRALDRGGHGVLKNHGRSAVTCIPLGRRVLCVKEYRTRGWLDRLKDLLRGSRARRAWRAAMRLLAAGVEIPEPIALLERGGTGFLVTRFVEHAAPLKQLLCERFGGRLCPAERDAKRALIRQLARWLRRLHDLGIYHDDWSAKNILAIERGGRWAFRLLDLDSIGRLKPLTRRRRVKNLGQINDAPCGVAATDRMRFLEAYAAGDRSLTRGRFPRAILAATRRRQAAAARVHAKALKRKAKQRAAAPS